MKLQIISAVLLVSLSQFSFAANAPKPNNCPTVSALQTVSITYVEQNDENGLWSAGVLSNNYQTNEKWSFAIGEFNATNEIDAKHQATDSLLSLKLQQGPLPFKINGEDSWICLYSDGSGHTAGAMTPPVDTLRSLVTHI